MRLSLRMRAEDLAQAVRALRRGDERGDKQAVRRRLLLGAAAGVPFAAALAVRAAAAQAPSAAAAASAASTSGGESAAAEAKAPPLPAPGTRLMLPAAELLEGLDGQRFDPTSAEGRVLLLYWWASWCPFCALTSPHVDKLWQAQRNRGLTMLTFSIDKRPEEARGYLRRRGYAWPAVWVSPALAKVLPKPKGLPVTLIRGRDGKVLQAEGGQLFPEDVEAMARHLG